MKRYIPVLTLIAFVGGLGAAYAGQAADRLRNPEGRGMGMSVPQYNKTMKQRRAKGMHPGQSGEMQTH